MLQYLRGDDPVERMVGEWQASGIALSGLTRAGMLLSGIRHGRERGPNLGQLGRCQVAGHHMGPSAGGLVGMAPETASQIQQPFARLQPKRL